LRTFQVTTNLLILFFLAACSTSRTTTAKTSAPQHQTSAPQGAGPVSDASHLAQGAVGSSTQLSNRQANSPDYAQLYDWAAHPSKKDPSDSVPFPLQGAYRYDSNVHVFFIHPTTFTGKRDTSDNASLLNEELNEKTDASSMRYQASAFNQYAVYAPRYRQAHLRNYYISDTIRALAAFELAYADVRAAFEYYLKVENRGKPIIIAAHSQGTTHAMRLVREFFDGKPLQDQLVAAYLVGMYVPIHTFQNLPVCTQPDGTGCVLSWRTYQQGYLTDFVKKERTPAVVVNPIGWTTDTMYVARDASKGALLRNFKKIYPRAVDAQIHGNVLWIHKPDVPGKILLRMKNYHIGDINLFYVDIRNNVDLRVQTYRARMRP
jgi:hypothetical protein